MQGHLKYVKRILLVTVLCFSFLANVGAVSAQEYDDDEIMQEYREKKSAGVEVYPLTDGDGNVLGYYEPHEDISTNYVMPRYTSNVNWEIESHGYGRGDNIYTLGGGSRIEVNISQSASGKSYIELYDRENEEYINLSSTETTSGWNGTIVLRSSFSDGTYSFSIHNVSDKTITYSGYYIL